MKLPPRAFRRFARQYHVSPTREFLVGWYNGETVFHEKSSPRSERAAVRMAEARKRALDQSKKLTPERLSLFSRIRRFISRRQS